MKAVLGGSANNRFSIATSTKLMIVENDSDKKNNLVWAF